MFPAALREGGGRGSFLAESPRAAGSAFLFLRPEGNPGKREGGEGGGRGGRRWPHSAPTLRAGRAKPVPSVAALLPFPAAVMSLLRGPRPRTAGRKGPRKAAAAARRDWDVSASHWRAAPAGKKAREPPCPRLGDPPPSAGAVPWKPPGYVWVLWAGRHAVCEGDTALLVSLALVEARPPASLGEGARSGLVELWFLVAAPPRVERSAAP